VNFDRQLSASSLAKLAEIYQFEFQFNHLIIAQKGNPKSKQPIEMSKYFIKKFYKT